MLRFRNYWIYSAGLAIAWAVVLLLTLVIRGTQSAQTLLLVFLGFCICWVSATIADTSMRRQSAGCRTAVRSDILNRASMRAASLRHAVSGQGYQR